MGKLSMEKHLDFTIDFESCSLSANAAVMQVAIVPWLRNNDTTPFCAKPYVGYVDLRTCVVDGFDFDPNTLKWWTQRSKKAKEAVTYGLPEPISDILHNSLIYITTLASEYYAHTTCLWAQGIDFDVAVLKTLCNKYGIDLEKIIPHTSFRDCRTVILEAAVIRAERNLRVDTDGVLPSQILADARKAYELYTPLPEEYAKGSEAHDALYDAVRSSWNTWQALKWLRGDN